MSADVPGVNKEDISLTVENEGAFHILNIAANRPCSSFHNAKEGEQEEWSAERRMVWGTRIERPCGKLLRYNETKTIDNSLTLTLDQYDCLQTLISAI